VNVSKDDFEQALAKTEGILSLQQGSARGWFTYTEIQAVCNVLMSWELIMPLFYTTLIKVRKLEKC